MFIMLFVIFGSLEGSAASYNTKIKAWWSSSVQAFELESLMVSFKEP